uniref:Uncharacterized protein n=1 Tax=Anguilla anguilla TaxID=7936 RepID=A0A0E9SUY7_ANGAN
MCRRFTALLISNVIQEWKHRISHFTHRGLIPNCSSPGVEHQAQPKKTYL